MLLAFCFVCAGARAQTNEWTWMGGSSTNLPTCDVSHLYCEQPGVYGTQGTPAAANIPGTRNGSATWVDSSGNFWLFGGQGIDSASEVGVLNDLWKFDPVAKQWTWISGLSTLHCVKVTPSSGQPYCNYEAPGAWGTLGAAAAGNTPSGRTLETVWTDNSGNLWLFGGYGIDAAGNVGDLNDLWEFNVSSSQWEWVNGSNMLSCYTDPDSSSPFCEVIGNYGREVAPLTPGGHAGAVGWKDSSGGLWLFGGAAIDSQGYEGASDELWLLTGGQWVWVGGSNTLTCNGVAEGIFCNSPVPPAAVYGTQGQPAAANTPGGRGPAWNWTDSNGNFWMQLGPTGKDELWEFNSSLKQWVWISGDTPAAEIVPASYGTLGVPSATNTPGTRDTVNPPLTWTDLQGNFWLYGGSAPATYNNGVVSAYTTGLDDLWERDRTTGYWTWMGGSATAGTVATPSSYNDLAGVYGSMGASAVGNIPGGRMNAAGWADSSGDFWLFGGSFDPIVRYTNSLWRYQPSAQSLPAAITPTFLPVAGAYLSPQTVTISNGMANATIYYTTDGTTPTTNSSQYNGPFTLGASSTVQAIAVASGYPNSAVGSAAYTITTTVATPTFSVAGGTYNSAQSVTLSDTTPGAAIYYTTDGSTPSTNSSKYSNAIPVSTTETINAIAVAAGLSNSAVGSATYTIKLPTFNLSSSGASMAVNSGSQGTATLTVIPLNGFASAVSFACSGLPSGATCSFNPATVTPSGSAANTQLTITVSSQARLERKQIPWAPESTLALAACVLLWKRRKSWPMFAILLAASAAAGILSGCGGGGSAASIPKPVNSTVTVTASSGTIQQTLALTLTVN